MLVGDGARGQAGRHAASSRTCSAPRTRSRPRGTTAVERLCDPSHARALPLSEFERLFRAQGLELLREPTSELHYDVEEWIAHGGPDAATAAEIRRLLEASIEDDATGLAVYRQDGRLRFRHRTAAFVLRKPLGGQIEDRALRAQPCCGARATSTSAGATPDASASAAAVPAASPVAMQAGISLVAWCTRWSTEMQRPATSRFESSRGSSEPYGIW